MVDCLKHAVDKENEIPRIINFIYEKLNNKSSTFDSFNKNMRKAEEIMKDYGLI